MTTVGKDDGLPIIGSTDPEPVRFSLKGDRIRAAYKRRHGAALIEYSGDNPLRAENIELPDGTRGWAQCTMGRRWRRPHVPFEGMAGVAPATIPVSWQWGTLDISDHDVVFRPGPLPEPDLDGPAAELKRELYANHALRTLVREFDAAMTLYRFFINCDFVRVRDGHKPSFDGNGDVAQLIADLRGIGEYHLDIEMCDMDPIADPEAAATRLEAALVDAGWDGSFERSARVELGRQVVEKIRSLYPEGAGSGGFFGNVTLDDGTQHWVSYFPKDAPKLQK